MQMGSSLKIAMFDDDMAQHLTNWADEAPTRRRLRSGDEVN